MSLSPSNKTPLYGNLTSFGSVDFDSSTAYLTNQGMRKPRPVSFNLGSSLPVDTLAGGVAPYDSSSFDTYTIWLLAEEGAAEDQCSIQVEHKYQTLLEYLVKPDGDGFSQQIQTLTAQLQSGTSVSCKASIEDLTQTDTRRAYSSLQAVAVFRRFTEWT